MRRAKPTKKRPTTGDKRDAILAAALGLFARLGYAATPVPDVAGAAGVAAGTIYRYFASKDDLLNCVYRTWKRRFLDELSVGFPESGTSREQFSHLWRAMLRFAAASPAAFDFLESHFHAPYLDAESRALEDEILGFARQFVVVSQKSGHLKAIDPDLVIALVFGAFVNLVKQRRLGRLVDKQSVDDAAEQCLWEAFAAESTNKRSFV
jgi:AcrR family transcriptional regulator